MIPRTIPTWQMLSWQDELKQQINTPEALLAAVGLDDKWLPAAQAGHRLFPISATQSYVSRIRKGDPKDPLLLQILPTLGEQAPQTGYSNDPLEEQRFSPCPGLIHKYRSRVLFIAASHCAINCRYCFRRHFPYQENRLSRQQWQTALAYIEDKPEINEVILSGGDPLSLSDRQLHWLSTQIAAIPHVRRLRVHTRYPIILPSRITPELISSLQQPSLKTIVVSHCNHPQEIDQPVAQAFSLMDEAKFLLLNQTVLLKNINDRSKILASLSESLFELGVQPYYLHLLDRVNGATHFEIKNENALALYRDLLARLPGYLVPKLVREIPDEASKTPIGLA